MRASSSAVGSTRSDAASPITAVRMTEWPASTATFAQGPMGAERRHVLAEGLEFPAHAGAKRVEVHALDHREVAQDEVADLGRRGRDPEPAVAHHRGRHTEGGRRGERPVPRDLGVVVGVQVDDARRESQSLGVDLAFPGLADVSDGADAPVAHCDVGPDRFVAETVDDGGSADDEVVHCESPWGQAVGTAAANHRRSARTTEVSIWRSGIVQYRRSSVAMSSTTRNPCRS